MTWAFQLPMLSLIPPTGIAPVLLRGPCTSSLRRLWRSGIRDGAIHGPRPMAFLANSLGKLIHCWWFHSLTRTTEINRYLRSFIFSEWFQGSWPCFFIGFPSFFFGASGNGQRPNPNTEAKSPSFALLIGLAVGGLHTVAGAVPQSRRPEGSVWIQGRWGWGWQKHEKTRIETGLSENTSKSNGLWMFMIIFLLKSIILEYTPFSETPKWLKCTSKSNLSKKYIRT